MKRFALIIFTGLFLCIGLNGFNRTTAKNSAFPSSSVVISQFQAAGGVATDEFIELHNVGANSVDLSGQRVVYRSAAGTNDLTMVEWTTATVIPAGGYYLVTSNTYDGSVAGNISYNTGSVSMSGTGGGIAIRSGAANTGTIIDSIGYGTATNIFVETATTTAPAANSAQARGANGCQDTDNNSSDFANLNPAAPRNAASATNICGGGGATPLSAAASSNPNSAQPGQAVLLTAAVTAATDPVSTGIAVCARLENIGASPIGFCQPFFNDGTNGDAVAGDNIFSYSTAVAANVSGGAKLLPVAVTDAEGRTANAAILITVNAPASQDDPLALGNPSNAVTDVNQPFNYLMIKPQYSLSYHRDRGEPNWVAWKLDASWLGDADRQDNYRPDPQLPAEWYHVTTNDYTGSGYTRGHMCPSGDRTNSIENNSATFLMTNFVPQTAANNNGTWNEEEMYLRTLAQAGNEIYTFSGGAGSLGTIAGGRVNIPAVTWKVAVVLPNGDNDLQRVTKNTRVISVIVPNTSDVVLDWRRYRVSVDKIENLTGYDFLSNSPKIVQRLVESRIDTQ